MNIYKNNDDSDLKPTYIKFSIMQKMFTHNQNYGNNRGVNLQDQKNMQNRNQPQEFRLES